MSAVDKETPYRICAQKSHFWSMNYSLFCSITGTGFYVMLKNSYQDGKSGKESPLESELWDVNLHKTPIAMIKINQ